MKPKAIFSTLTLVAPGMSTPTQLISNNTLVLCNDFNLKGPCSYLSLPYLENRCGMWPPSEPSFLLDFASR